VGLNENLSQFNSEQVENDLRKAHDDYYGQVYTASMGFIKAAFAQFFHEYLQHNRESLLNNGFIYEITEGLDVHVGNSQYNVVFDLSNTTNSYREAHTGYYKIHVSATLHGAGPHPIWNVVHNLDMSLDLRHAVQYDYVYDVVKRWLSYEIFEKSIQDGLALA
jgi:hypothetical protein